MMNSTFGFVAALFATLFPGTLFAFALVVFFLAMDLLLFHG
jgi:hypothetical protein